MAYLFSYPQWHFDGSGDYDSEGDAAEYDLEEQRHSLEFRFLCELAGIFQNQQDEFGLGNLPVVNTFPAEEQTKDMSRCQTIEQLRNLPILTSRIDFDNDQKFSSNIMSSVVNDMDLHDLTYRFGAEALYDHIASLQAQRRDEILNILPMAVNAKDSWIPWNWVSNMTILSTTEYCTVASAYVKAPFVGCNTKGKLVYLRKVTDISLIMEIYRQSIGNNHDIYDHVAITIDSLDGHVCLVSTPGHDLVADDMQSLELELKEPFAGWLSVFITLGWLSLTSTHTVHTRNWHSDLHPRNVFASRLKQYIWPYAIQEVQPSRVYGRLPYLPPESEQAGSKRNPKWDVYAFGIIMWQLVSRVTFPSDQYMDHDVYRIDRIPGVPEWYEQLYISCLNKDPEARPDMAVLRRQFSQYTRNSTMIFRKNPEPEPFQVEKELRDYQRLRAEMITIHLETCLAPSNISLQSSSDFYSREQLSNYIGFRLVSL